VYDIPEEKPKSNPKELIGSILVPRHTQELLLLLLYEDLNREILAKKIGTQTGPLNKAKDFLHINGMMERPKGKGNELINTLTPRGMWIAYEVDILYKYFWVDDEEKIQLMLDEVENHRTKMMRINEDGLFDMRVAERLLEKNYPNTKKLRSLVMSIVKGRKFTKDEVLTDYNKIFPINPISKNNINTSFTKFTKNEKKNKNYIRGLRRVENGTYVLE